MGNVRPNRYAKNKECSRNFSKAGFVSTLCVFLSLICLAISRCTTHLSRKKHANVRNGMKRWCIKNLCFCIKIGVSWSRGVLKSGNSRTNTNVLLCWDVNYGCRIQKVHIARPDPTRKKSSLEEFVSNALSDLLWLPFLFNEAISLVIIHHYQYFLQSYQVTAFKRTPYIPASLGRYAWPWLLICWRKNRKA